MELRAVDGVRIADKTVLKMMREMGLRCGIRRKDGRRRYSSYRGEAGETFGNVLGRDFEADGPWQKMGTDVTEFKCSFGKAYLAPVYDFGSKEIVAWSVSERPDLAQQEEMLAMLMAAKPEGARPILHSDMGWQYQHAAYVGALAENGFVQSMSRKGNCIDNGATEQVFGHVKDEFFRGRDWGDFESFKSDLDAYIVHWNTRRRQVKLKGLTPACLLYTSAVGIPFDEAGVPPASLCSPAASRSRRLRLRRAAHLRRSNSPRPIHSRCPRRPQGASPAHYSPR